MENNQFLNSTSENGLRLAQMVPSVAPKSAARIRGLVFTALLSLFVLLAAANLGFILALTWLGQPSLLGGHVPYLENAVFGVLCLAMLAAGVFRLRKAK